MARTVFPTHEWPVAVTVPLELQFVTVQEHQSIIQLQQGQQYSTNSKRYAHDRLMYNAPPRVAEFPTKLVFIKQAT